MIKQILISIGLIYNNWTYWIQIVLPILYEFKADRLGLRMYPEENCLPLQPLTTYSSSFSGRALWNFPPTVLCVDYCDLCWSCAGNDIIESSLEQHPCHAQKTPSHSLSTRSPTLSPSLTYRDFLIDVPSVAGHLGTPQSLILGILPVVDFCHRHHF